MFSSRCTQLILVRSKGCWSHMNRHCSPNKLLFNKFSGFAQRKADSIGYCRSINYLPKTIWRGIRQKTPGGGGGGGGGRKKGLVPVDEVTQAGESRLLKPFCFALTVGGLSFSGAAIWQYETLRDRAKKALHGAPRYDNRFFGKAGSFRHHVNLWWNGLSAGQKAVAGIIGLNCGVFMMWRIPALQSTMLKWFASSPFSGAPCWSMLLSSFSHYSFLHLAVNMYVLWSFTPTITTLLGREQFVAMYLTAGVFSGFTGHLNKVLRHSLRPSIGASGAIMAVLGAVCWYYPNAELSIAFVGELIPHSFSARTAVAALLTMDTLGVLLRWRLFDHAAHLGGMLFGIWYVSYGHKLIWANRESVMKWWHKYRGKP